MTGQILVALDGSTLAEAVLPHAMGLAGKTGSELTLLRVVPFPVYIAPVAGIALDASQLWETSREEANLAKAYLQEVAERLRLRGMAVHLLVVEGDPASCILDYIYSTPSVEAVAIATHGRSGVGRWLLGSVAEHVLHSASMPVLMVHSIHSERYITGPLDKPSASETTVYAPRRYRTIVVPLDGSELAEEALRQAKALAADRCSHIELLSVVPRPGPWERTTPVADPLALSSMQVARIRRMQDYLMDVACRLSLEGYIVNTKVKEGNPAEMIIEAGQVAQDSLIVMTTHRRSGLERLWLGSIAMKVVQGTTTPVMLMRSSKQVEETVRELAVRFAH